MPGMAVTFSSSMVRRFPAWQLTQSALKKKLFVGSAMAIKDI